MKHALLLSLLLFSGGLTHAQAGNHVLNASTVLRVMDDGAGGGLLVVERRFGFDSTYMELLHADADWSSTPLTACRFGSPLYFLFDAVKLSSGPLVSGLFPNSSSSSLHRLNNDGSLAWSVTINGMTNSQRRFPKIFANGDGFVAYSNADGFFSDLFYRLEGDATGTSWSAREISTNDDVPYRFYDGAATGAPGEHILVGSRRNGTDAQVLMARVSGAGVQWMKQYQLNSPELEYEEAVDAVALGNDEFACVMSMNDGGTTAAVVMRFSGDGTPIWTTKLTDPSGLFGGALARLDDGTLLVAGSTSLSPRLIRLSATGAMLWAKGCPGCFGGIGSFHRTGAGALVGTSADALYEIAPDGIACDFTDISSLMAAPFTPGVSALSATSTPVTLTAANVPVLDRAPVNELSTTCVLSGLPEAQAQLTGNAWPTPTEGRVRISGVHDGEPFFVRALDGRTVLHGTYRDGVDLSTLPAGGYLLDLPAMGLRARALRE